MSQTTFEGFRLSPQQQRIWQLQANGSSAYYIQGQIALVGPLARETLQAALATVVARHEILRTRFVCEPAETLALQVIRLPRRPVVPEYNWQRLDAQAQQERIQALLREWREYPLGTGPLLRTVLVRLSATQRMLLVSLPALLADLMTLGHFVRELSHAYAYHRYAEPLAHADIMQYADVAEWLNGLLESEETAPGRAYWSRRASAPPMQALPCEQPAALGQPLRTQSVTIDLPQVAEIQTFVQEQRTSLKVLLLACWQLLLWRRTDQGALTLGYACDGRNYPELCTHLGPLTRYLPLQGNLEAKLPFTRFLQQTHQAIHNACAWQEYFEATDPPLAFGFDMVEVPASEVVGEVQFSLQWQYACLEPFKVRLSGLLGPEELRLELHYDARCFQQSDIEILARQFQALLDHALRQPDTPLARLALLSPTERQRLLVAFNHTEQPFPDRPLHQLFAEQVQRTPAHTAVRCPRERLTYHQLNCRANQLAHYLQTRGCAPGTRVAVLLERSCTLLVALLAVLKTGAAYVPLDPRYPSQRLDYMLTDAQPLLLLSAGEIAPPDAPVPLLRLDDFDFSAYSPQDPPPAVHPEDLAYLIYTSGSTGRPKGTMIPHRALVNYLWWACHYYRVVEGTGAPVASSIAFDATLTALFTPLLVGRMVAMLPDAVETLVTDLSSGAGYSLVKLTPAHLDALTPLIQEEEIASGTQTLVLGGEALLAQSLTFWRTRTPWTRLINEYGPTEATVGCCVYTIGAGEELRTQVPIGRPIANTELYILDEDLEPVPIGIPGELYIGGAGLALGYWNQPQLTAQKFIPHPFRAQERLYKTGDRARFLADGTIEYLGRIDHQVKLRGLRIELGEIEALLREYVREAVVLLREDAPGDKRLVAYVVGASDSAQLRGLLQQKVPEYMVPGAFVFLEAMPLTPNGKVDRCALPAPVPQTAAYQAPRTPVEELLVRLWAQVLGLPQVGIHDNFFALGGDSILSLQIVARARQLGLNFEPRQVFQYQTIAELAAVTPLGTPPSAQQGPVTGLVPLTPIQHWFFEQNLAQPHHFNQSLCLELPTTPQPELLQQALHHLLVHHDALRLRFTPLSTGWQQSNDPIPVPLPFSVVDLAGYPAPEQAKAWAEATTSLQSSLDLTTGPLLSAGLFTFGPEQPSRLLLVVHHLVVDGVSWRILLEDLATLCRQSEQGKPLALPPKTTSFKAWAEHLATYAPSEELVMEQDYWQDLKRLRVTPLPLDYPADPTANTVADVARVAVTLDCDQTRVLLQELPARHETQVNDVLLTALVQAFGAWTGEPALLIDLERHGREEQGAVDLSRTVGWFTTLTPLCLEQTATTLQTVKAQLRRLPRLGYGLLRYHPAFQDGFRALLQPEVRFNYLGQWDQGLPSLALSREPSGPEQSTLNQRPYLLEVDALVLEGVLHIRWTYSTRLHRPATIERLAQDYLQALQELIHSPSIPPDFVSPEQFDRLLAEIALAEE
ncbi:non-ribosomal peptide synthetase [Anthocerotibacter panamensis]|uniref:non-ribosomal peptide synthetase n=1 Tax=Anthocerotibacter panamensis TaxID=2857077 RepID=UPI001C405B39|nr:non-ribosomal peptide synthetase [Anthocerotibacter panamensis]